MKINFATVMLDLKGEPLKNMDRQDLTLGHVCVESLMAPGSAYTQPVAGNVLQNYHRLAERIHKGMTAGEEVSITAEEATILKDRVAAGYQTATVVGPAFALLDGEKPDDASTH
jgi:hypothetical protein